MKFLENVLKSYLGAKDLREENQRLKEEIEELRDANESLWLMLEEIKEAEAEAISSYALLSSAPAGEA